MIEDPKSLIEKIDPFVSIIEISAQISKEVLIKQGGKFTLAKCKPSTVVRVYCFNGSQLRWPVKKYKLNERSQDIRKAGLPIEFGAQLDIPDDSEIVIEDDSWILCFEDFQNIDDCITLVVAFAQHAQLPKISQQQSLKANCEEICTLLDPITLKAIDVPVIGKNCSHIKPFDLETYLQCQREQGLDWKCPICRKVNYYEDLLMVGHIYEFLKSYSHDDISQLRVRLTSNTVDRCEIQDSLASEEQNKSDNETQQQNIRVTFTLSNCLITNLSKILAEVLKDRTFIEDQLNTSMIQALFTQIQSLQLDQFVDILNQVYLQSNVYINPDEFQFELDPDEAEPLRVYCKHIFDKLEALFSPFLFWANATERNLIKCFSKLSLFRGAAQNLLYQASAYYIYKNSHQEKISFEFIYGKLFGYHFKKLGLMDQSAHFTVFIEKHINQFPHLHLPNVQLTNSSEIRCYYKRMTNFYIGLLSWFNIHFIGHAMKQIFTPPKRVETLDEKACINLFVQQVLMRILTGLKFSIGKVITFYEIWDEHRVVLRMDKGYQYGQLTEQIGQFKQIIKMRQTSKLKQLILQKQ